MKQRTQLKQMILCAFFAALTAVLSQISFPLPFTPVPINLATLSVLLSGGLLGARYGSLSQFLFVLLGGIGLPIFHNFTGGLGTLIGPTGGYLIGYILASFITGVLINMLSKPKKRSTGGKAMLVPVLAMAAGMLVCYALGTAWFIILTGTGLVEALLLCVVPFLLGDGLKIVLAAFLVRRLSTLISI